MLDVDPQTSEWAHYWRGAGMGVREYLARLEIHKERFLAQTVR